MSFMQPEPKRPGMTSVEAAALYLSGGQTTDPVKADLIDRGQLLDPEALEKAHFRRAMGFDFDITISPETHKAYAKDKELGYMVSAAWTEGADANNAARITRACIKLKKLHDAKLAEVSDD